MEVFINNQAQTIDPTADLLSLLRVQGISDQKGIAVALNNAVIPRTGWSNTILRSGDRITIIRATQGG